MLRIKPEGVVAIKRIDLIQWHTQRGMRHALFEIADDYTRTANFNILKEKKRGRTYLVRTRTGRQKRHRSSAAGQSHANLTGALRRSIGWKVRGSSQLEFGYGATSNTTKYARRIELGGGNIKARPSLKIAIQQNRRNTMNNIERFAKKGLGI